MSKELTPFEEMNKDTGIMIPIKALSKSQQITTGEDIANRLLIIHNAKTAYVLLAQAENLLDTAKKSIKEKAIANVVGKKEDVLGAEVTIKSAAKLFIYTGSKYNQLLAELDNAKTNLKNHTKLLELSGESGWVNPETGETETAVCTSAGVNIAVSFSKEAV